MKIKDDIPDDMKEAPFEIQREFIRSYNRAIGTEKDPLQEARKSIAKKYGQVASEE